MPHQARPPNSCHKCGSASYRPVIGRDAHGALKPTGMYVCTGCKFQFRDIRDWRNGVSEQEPVSQY